jgi:hypothetical protein
MLENSWALAMGRRGPQLLYFSELAMPFLVPVKLVVMSVKERGQGFLRGANQFTIDFMTVSLR